MYVDIIISNAFNLNKHFFFSFSFLFLSLTFPFVENFDVIALNDLLLE